MDAKGTSAYVAKVQALEFGERVEVSAAAQAERCCYATNVHATPAVWGVKAGASRCAVLCRGVPCGARRSVGLAPTHEVTPRAVAQRLLYCARPTHAGSWAVHAGMFSIQYRPTPDSEGKPLEADFNVRRPCAASRCLNADQPRGARTSVHLTPSSCMRMACPAQLKLFLAGSNAGKLCYEFHYCSPDFPGGQAGACRLVFVCVAAVDELHLTRAPAPQTQNGPDGAPISCGCACTCHGGLRLTPPRLDPHGTDKNKARVQLDISSITGLQENAANNTLMLQLSRPPTVEMGLQAFVEVRTREACVCSHGLPGCCTGSTWDRPAALPHAPQKDQNMVKLRTKYSHKDRSDCSNGVIAACSRHTVQLARAATMR